MNKDTIFIIACLLVAWITERWNIPLYHGEGERLDGHFIWTIDIGVNPVALSLCSSMLALYLAVIR